MTWLLDPITGQTLVEGITSEEAQQIVGDLLPMPHDLYCAAPLTLGHLSPASAEEIASHPCLRIAGFYHDSLIEGPGRRSVAKLQGCPIRCLGCVAESTWPADGGYLVPVDRLATALLDPAFERDGITILGGEPLFQPEGLLALVRILRTRGCPHLLVYSGYTYEQLQRMARVRPAIGAVLAAVDLLIDGPFVTARAQDAGPWTGSGNQRVIDLVATRRTRTVRLWSDTSAVR